MAKKVKVSRETAFSIEKALEVGSKESLLIYHSNNFLEDGSLKEGKTWTAKEYLGLNELSPEELAIALYVGYEIEETPEEKLAEVYKKRSTGSSYDNGFSGGIYYAISVLGLKIKGINDEVIP